MLRVEGLEKFFDKTKVLGPISAEFVPGKIYGLLGSNGSGKSTFLRCLSGIYFPEGGSVILEGSGPVFENEIFKKQMYLVSDDPYYFPQGTMDEMARFYRNFYDSWDDTTYERFCAVFPLDTKARLSTFSKGMRRQADIILGFSISPQYIYLDEAFDGLDPVMRNVLKRMMMEELAEKNVTIIITSHNIAEFENICDEVLILHHGELIDRRIADDPGNILKVQVALDHIPTIEDFSEISVKSISVQGRIATLLIRGEEEEILEKLGQLSPLYLEALPTSLEEIFMMEMEEVGYNAANII